jgi:molybdopterin molybdotransferase
MRGLTEIDLPTVMAEATGDFVNRDDRVHYMRANLRRDGEKWLAIPMPRQGSHVISSLANANCLVEVPEATTISQGHSVSAIRFSENE